MKTEGGAKILEQVVIPTTDQVKEFPAIQFSYFDDKKQLYQTVTEGPFSIAVQKLGENDQLKIAGFGEQQALVPEERLGRDIVFIKETSPKFHTRKAYLFRNLPFIGFVILSFGVWFGLLIRYRITHRLKTDVIYARRLYAPKRAKKELNRAEIFLQKEQQVEFCYAILKSLQEYFGNKFHLVSATITFQTLENRMKSQGIDQKIVESIKSIFAECDLVRYASFKLDNEKMKFIYQKAQEIIDYLERHLK